MSISDDSHFDPDDPRLTAYALGELPDAADRAHVEALLAASPEARAELADIRSLTAALTAEYEQELFNANDAATPAPTNVIRLPQSSRRLWLRPLLATAAVLFLSGLLATWVIPVSHPARVGNSRRDARPARQIAEAPAPEAASDKTTRPAGEIARNDGQPSGQITPIPPAPTPTSELLAAAPPAAAPPVSLATQNSPAVGGHVAFLSSRNVYSGANAPMIKDLSADMSKSPTAKTGRETAAGTIFPPSTDADPAPGGPLLAESQAMAPRKVLRASSNSARSVAKAAVIGGLSAGAVSPSLDESSRSRPQTPSADRAAETPFLTAKENPLSTFPVDGGTASYSTVRRFIEQGSLPPAGAVRIEEILNSFPYDDLVPAPGDTRPCAIHLEGAACPWNPDHRLVRIALTGQEIDRETKTRVEFNPAVVHSYRLIGDEKRLPREEDSGGDRVPAVGTSAGRGVTALYEIVPVRPVEAGSAAETAALPVDARELLTVKVRHEAPGRVKIERSYEAVFTDRSPAADDANASPDFKFAAAVASFGLVLRDSPYKGNATLGAAINLAQEGKGSDPNGSRAGFIELVRRAQALPHRGTSEPK